MTMGQTGMGGMGEMAHAACPTNSMPMLGGDGPFGYIDMGGMFTILKVRDGINDLRRTRAGTSTRPGRSPRPRRRRSCSGTGSPGEEMS